MGQPYSKPALTFEQQLKLLEDRGVVVADRDQAIATVSRISYYRLSAYFSPLRAANDLSIPRPSVTASPPDPDQRDGYLVVARAGVAFACWEHEIGSANLDKLNALRAAVPGVNPARCCGVQRGAVSRWWEGEPRLSDHDPDAAARKRIHDLLGPDPTLEWEQPPWFDPDLLPGLQVAREVLALTDKQTEKELIRVTRGEGAPTTDTAGFDVGYWGSDHTSLIADVMVMPRWHSSADDGLAGLMPWALSLNEHVLFRSMADASAYRQWYLVQPWAETEIEPGQLQVIRVDFAR